MARAKNSIIIFALILFSTQAAISEEAKISNTRQARCVVKVIFNKGTLPLSLKDMYTFIRSPNVLGKTVNEILESLPEHEIPLNHLSINSEDNGDKYTYSCEIYIELTEKVKPVAVEFLKALIDNLKISLENTFNDYQIVFDEQYMEALKKFKKAEVELNELNEEPAIKIEFSGNYTHGDFVSNQLEEKVDLSMLDPSMSIGEVLDNIAHSVKSPLQIQPNWRDLADLPEILPTTPAEMEPLTGVKVRTAIEILLKGLSTVDVPIGYEYFEGVITIATEDALPKHLVTAIYDVSGLLVNGRTSNTLIEAIKKTIEPESWYDENISAITSVPSETYAGYGGGYIDIPSLIKTGEGKIVDMQGGKISIYNTPEIQDKVMKFLTSFPKEIPSEPVGNLSLNLLIQEKQDLSRHKRSLELEVARLEARRAAAEQQIMSLSGKMKTEESRDILKRNRDNLVRTLDLLKPTRTENHPEVVAVQKQIDKINEQINATERDTITAELEQLIERQTQQLEFLKQQVEVGAKSPSELSDAEAKLVQAKIQLARRREELARPVGVEQLGTLNENLSMAILDLAEKKAEFNVIERQLGEIEGQIKAASTTDTKVLKYRQAKRAFEEAEKHLNELKDIKENMQPPQVITIGLE